MAKAKLNLKDLKPTRAQFKLALFVDRDFHLKPFTLSDEIWLTDKFGTNLEKAFQDRKSVCEIAWHQLEERNVFKKQKVKFTNDEGDELEVEQGGFQLFANSISGAEEQMEMIKAIMQTFGISKPMMDELNEELEKKNQEALNQQIGETLSTSSQVNMDGVMNTSSPGLDEKSI